MKEIILYKSPKKSLQLILPCLLFVLLGIFIVSRGGGWIGWMSIIFFGLGIPIAVINLLDRRPQIIINEIGVFDRTIHKEVINWEVIRDAYPISINGQKFIALVIDEDFKPSRKKGFFYRKTARLNELIGAQELNLNLTMVNVDEVQLTLLIQSLIRADKRERKDMINSIE